MVYTPKRIEQSRRDPATDAKDYAQVKAAFGLEKEKIVRQFLEEMYQAPTKDSTKDEDYLQDIDCWFGGVGISIKSQAQCHFTKNLGFELEKFDTKIDQHNHSLVVEHPHLTDKYGNLLRGVWVPSWYQTGQAKYYIICIVDRIYQVSKERLINHVDTYGWDRITDLSKRVLEEHETRRFRDYRNGLIKLQTLVQFNVARCLGNLR